MNLLWPGASALLSNTKNNAGIKKLWARYRRATHSGAIANLLALSETVSIMATESSPRKDSMKVEKLSLLVLSLCIAVLVYLLVARPF